MRGRVCRDGRGSVHAKEIPSAGCDQYGQSREPERERRERRTPYRFGRLRRGRLADLQRIGPDRLGNVLELGRAEIGNSEIEPPLHLTIGVLGETDGARLCDALEPDGDVDAIAHQIAVALLDPVAEMNADAKLDAALGRQTGVALDHAALNLDGAAHG